ncbi:MAG: amidohydrolase family protein, partial [Gammaproteobacteria bacterium]|nr:amidohydrolase family protein [Gammaproteobacteria bacterium]
MFSSKISTTMIRIAAVVLLISGNYLYADEPTSQVYITDVDIFDGHTEKLHRNRHVLVEGNLISKISSSEINDLASDAVIINGAGRVMVPGLIDTHSHLSLTGSPGEMRDWSWERIGVLMGKRAETTLMWGFTTVRDLGGPVMGLKQNIDEGLVPGPRIFPSLAFITQTGGHGDFRAWTDPHPRWFDETANWERLGFYRLADGVPDVLASVRENLSRGATQIKLMGSGGVGSEYDPIDSVQYTLEEQQAAVRAAEDWGTYVGAHLHNGPAIIRALQAGLKSIDHGFGIDEEGMKMLVSQGAFLNTHFAWNHMVLEADFLNEFQLAKAREVISWSDNMVRLAKKHKPKITYCVDAFGSDDLFNALYAMEFRARAEHFSPLEILRQATSGAAELLEQSGKRNPYRQGRLGVIEKGAYADLLVVDGDPLADITLFSEPEKNLRLIVKDGIV